MKAWFIVFAFLFLTLMIVKACNSPYTGTVSQSNNDFNIQYAAKNSVKERLKDPKSAVFENVYVKNGIACGFVNAKNSFGGYTGREGFISAGIPSATFLQSEFKAGDFDKLWQLKC